MLSRATFESLAERQTPQYWSRVREEAARLQTDGCSGPAKLTQWYKDSCYEHDVHYRTGLTLQGLPISREQADDLKAIRVRQMAWDGLGWNPLSWKHLGGFAVSGWRWAALRVGGGSSWAGDPNEV